MKPLPASVLALLVLLASGGDAAARRRCSLVLTFGYRSTASTVLLATSLADTLLAGPGTVLAGRGGHSGDGRPGPIFGQLARLDRFAGADSVLLARALQDRADRLVLLVPWDYGPSCGPSRWTGSFAWLPAGTTGTYSLRLRPRAHWVDGIPVFDVFAAALEPYPRNLARRRDRTIPPAHLSADQYFQLLAAVPTREEQERDPEAAWRQVQRWTAAHPELVALFPTRQVERQFAYDVVRWKQDRALHSIDPVVAGTYRLSLQLDGEPARHFFIRTSPRATSEWQPFRHSPPALEPTDEPPVPEAYYVHVVGAATAEQLPPPCATDAGFYRGAYLYVIDGVAGRQQRTEWPGWIEPMLAARQFPSDSALARFVRQFDAEWGERYRATRELEAPARFFIGPDSVFRVAQVTRLASGLTLVLRGERISRETADCGRIMLQVGSLTPAPPFPSARPRDAYGDRLIPPR